MEKGSSLPEIIDGLIKDGFELPFQYVALFFDGAIQGGVWRDLFELPETTVSYEPPGRTGVTDASFPWLFSIIDAKGRTAGTRIGERSTGTPPANTPVNAPPAKKEIGH